MNKLLIFLNLPVCVYCIKKGTVKSHHRVMITIYFRLGMSAGDRALLHNALFLCGRIKRFTLQM